MGGNGSRIGGGSGASDWAMTEPTRSSHPNEQIQPEVRIRREDDRTVEEYRSGGRVYMVRIQPTAGPAYYLIDTTGDGLMDLRHDRFEPVKPVYWKIFEW